MVSSRILSLLFLMLSATITQIIITVFIDFYIDSSVTDPNAWDNYFIVTVLMTPLITVLSSTSGIAGGQSSAMIVRSLSLKEIEGRDLGRVLWKELRVGLVCATVVSGINVGRMILVYAVQFQGNLKNPVLWYAVAILSISMFLSIVVSKLIGGTLPIIAKLWKLDPAAVTTPIVTTIIDILSTTAFFSIGLIFLN